MKKILLILILPIALIIFASAVTNSSGSVGGYTNSPGDANNCTHCHGGTIDIQSGWISSNIPATGYVAGTTYLITITGTHTGVAKFGFEATAEDSLINKVGMMKVVNSTENKITSKNSITHTSTGNNPTNDSRTWTFEWEAPIKGTGSVTFYAALVAANANSAPTGDIVYGSSLKVKENISTFIADNTKKESVIISPIPTNEYLDIKTSEELKSISIYSIEGSLVYKKEFNKSLKNYRININDNKLSKGIYFTKLWLGNNQAIVKRIIIL